MISWNTLDSVEKLDEIIALSHSNDIDAVAIFKHSTRCSISSISLKRFELDYIENPRVPMYFLDLLRYRSISNLVAETFNVEHESPQLLIIKNGKCILHESHMEIRASMLEIKAA
jgi:bacillithiol system protein YtxJ